MKHPRKNSSYRAARREAAKEEARLTGRPLHEVWPKYRVQGANWAQALKRRNTPRGEEV